MKTISDPLVSDGACLNPPLRLLETVVAVYGGLEGEGSDEVTRKRNIGRNKRTLHPARTQDNGVTCSVSSTSTCRNLPASFQGSAFKLGA